MASSVVGACSEPRAVRSGLPPSPAPLEVSYGAAHGVQATFDQWLGSVSGCCSGGHGKMARLDDRQPSLTVGRRLPRHIVAAEHLAMSARRPGA